MSSNLFKPEHLKQMMNKAKSGKVYFGFTCETAPFLVLDDELTGKALLAKAKKKTGDKKGCGGVAWIENGVFMLQPDKPLPGLKTQFIEMAKQANLKVKRARVLGADGKPLEPGKDGSSFSEAADEWLEDEKAAQVSRLHAQSDEPAFLSLQKDLEHLDKAGPLPTEAFGMATISSSGSRPTSASKTSKSLSGTWDPKTIEDFGPTLYSVAKPYEIQNPDLNLPIDEDKGLNTLTDLAAGSGGKLKFSVPVETKGKYIKVESIDVTFEGTLNLGTGEIGSVQPMGNREKKAGKSKSGVYEKINVDMWKKEFAGSVALKLKSTVELGELDGKTKAELSETFEAKIGVFGVEIKVVAFSYDESKPAGKQWDALSVKPSAFLSNTWKMVVNGVPVSASGKASIGLTIKVDWSEVMLEIGRKKSAEWALEKLSERAAQATAASGEAVAVGAATAETIPTGMAAITAGEIAVAGAAVAGVVMTVATVYKALEEKDDMETAGKLAGEMSTSFQNGYLALFGIKTPKGGPLYDKGKETARAKFILHVNRAKVRYAEQTGKFPGDDVGKEIGKIMVDHVRQNERAFRAQVHGMFDTYIRSAALRAWKEKSKKSPTTEKNEKFVRTYMGLSDIGDLPSEPDWQYMPGSQVETSDL